MATSNKTLLPFAVPSSSTQCNTKSSKANSTTKTASNTSITPVINSNNKRSKPKRPLSGYNLFYRFKRNKVLEATAKHGDDQATIHSVLTAFPGLENIPPHHALFSFPPSDINDIRASNIRLAMEGKLFPNENARNRLHRKVHGMGFVEMGKTMRDMWGGIDAFTKGVFCELADTGRVRYRNLMAEFKKDELLMSVAVLEQPLSTPAVMGSESAIKIKGPPAKRARKTALTLSSKSNNKMVAALVASVAADPVLMCQPVEETMYLPVAIEETPKPTEKLNVLASQPSMQMISPVNSTYAALINQHTPSLGYFPVASRRDSFEPLSVATTTIVPTATEDSCGTQNVNRSKWARRVSKDLLIPANSISIGSNMSDAAAINPTLSRRPSVMTVSNGSFFDHQYQKDTMLRNDNSNAEFKTQEMNDFQQFLLKNAMQSSIQNSQKNNRIVDQGTNRNLNMGPIPVPPLFQPPSPAAPQGTNSSSMSSVQSNYLEVIRSSSAVLANNNGISSSNGAMFERQQQVQAPQEQDDDVSAQDFMTFIGLLDEAIDDDSVSAPPTNNVVLEKMNAMNSSIKEDAFSIFGKPIHDVFNHPAPIPMPMTYELKNNRARMA